MRSYCKITIGTLNANQHPLSGNHVFRLFCCDISYLLPMPTVSLADVSTYKCSVQAYQADHGGTGYGHGSRFAVEFGFWLSSQKIKNV